MEIKDSPNHPKSDTATEPMFMAVWRGPDEPGTGPMTGKMVKRMVNSGWRPTSEQEDLTALAQRMNGQLFRGYFPPQPKKEATDEPT